MTTASTIYGAEGMLHCVSAVDGKLLWKVDTIKEFGVIQNFSGVGSAPVVEGNLLLVAVGGQFAGERPGAARCLESGETNGSAIVGVRQSVTGAVRVPRRR